MGISGLLPLLKEIEEDVHIGKFSGQVAAIDGYCWIHKAAICCAEELILGINTTRYVDFCMKYIDLLLGNKVRPVLIFDGLQLDGKKTVESTRKRTREESTRNGLALWRAGEKAKARECFKKAVDVTNEMALKVIDACREKGIQYLIAPFEADAQLTYLNQAGYADLVITEDSDLLVYGCKQVLFKMGANGTGKLIKKADLNRGLKLKEFSFDKFRHMCILSGCDYASSLRGIGLKRSKNLIELAGNKGIQWAIQNIRNILRMPSLTIPVGYWEKFSMADTIFQHQPVFDPVSKKVVPLSGDILNDYFVSGCPTKPSDDLAIHIAIGNINVETGERVRNFPLPNSETAFLPLSSTGNKDECTTAHPIREHDECNQSGSTQLKVVNLAEETFLWTIPCLPVLSIEWRKAKINQNGISKEALFRASDHRLLQMKTPVYLTSFSSCTIEIDHEHYTVVWEWDYITRQPDVELVRPGISNDNSFEDDVYIAEVPRDPNSDSDKNDPEEELVLHTLPFKVMGTAHKIDRQEHLEAAFQKLKGENVVIRAKIEADPENTYDANAIRVLIDYGVGFKHVGFIAQELTKFVHPVLNEGRLQHTCVYDIKFRTTWAKIGFYMTLHLTSRGEWPSQVLKASATVR